MQKPIVQYKSMGYNIEVGESADVLALDHPHLGRQWVITSTVQAITDDGFETLNTIYKLASDN